MRLLVCGGRHFDDSILVDGQLSRVHSKTPIKVLIHGGLPGLGVPVEAWARRTGVHLVRYPANFTLGKQGDFERDSFMLEDSRPDVLLVFPGGRRTVQLSGRAQARGIEIQHAQQIEALVAA